MDKTAWLALINTYIDNDAILKDLLQDKNPSDDAIDVCIKKAKKAYIILNPLVAGNSEENAGTGLIIYRALIELLQVESFIEKDEEDRFITSTSLEERASAGWVDTLIYRYYKMQEQHSRQINIVATTGRVGSEYGSYLDFNNKAGFSRSATHTAVSLGTIHSGGVDKSTHIYILSNSKFKWVFSKQAAAHGIGPYLQFDYILNKETGHEIDMSASPIWQMDLKLNLALTAMATKIAIPYSTYEDHTGILTEAAAPLKFTDGQDYVSIDDSQNDKLILKWTDFTYASIADAVNAYDTKPPGGLFTVEVTVEINDDALDMSLKSEINVDGNNKDCFSTLQSIRFPYLQVPELGPSPRAYTAFAGGEILLDPIGNFMYLTDPESTGRNKAGSQFPGDQAVSLQSWYDDTNKFGIMLYNLDPKHALKRIISTNVKDSPKWIMYERSFCNLDEEDFRTGRRRNLYTKSFDTAVNFYTDSTGATYGFKHKLQLFEGDEVESCLIYRTKIYNALSLVTPYSNPATPDASKEIPLSVWIIDDPTDNTEANEVLYASSDTLYTVLNNVINYYRGGSLELTDPIEVAPLTCAVSPWSVPTNESLPAVAFVGATGQIGYATEAENLANGIPNPLLDRVRKGLVQFLKDMHADTTLGHIHIVSNQDTGRIVENTVVSKDILGDSTHPDPYRPARWSNEYPLRTLDNLYVYASIYDKNGTLTKKGNSQSSVCPGSLWIDEYIREAKVIIDVFEGTMNYIKLTGASSALIDCFAPAIEGVFANVSKVVLGVLHNYCLKDALTSLQIKDTILTAGTEWFIGTTEGETAESLKEAVLNAGYFAFIDTATIDVPQVIIELEYGDIVKLTLPPLTISENYRGLLLSNQISETSYGLSSDYLKQAVYCEKNVTLTFDHPDDIPSPRGTMTINGIQSANTSISDINNQPDKWRPYKFSYKTVDGSTLIWQDTKALNAMQLANELNTLDVVSSTAIQASASGEKVLLQSNFIDNAEIVHGSKTRIDIECFEDRAYISELEALPEKRRPHPGTHTHPIGSSSFSGEAIKAAQTEIQLYGQAAALNGSFYSGTERNNMLTSIFGQGENEHHNMYPIVDAVHFIRSLETDRAHWINTLVVPYSSRCNILAHVQKGAPRSYGTFYARFLTALVKYTNEVGVANLPTELTDDAAMKRMTVTYMTYAQLFFLTFDAAPPTVYHCADTLNDAIKGRIYEGRLDGDPEYDAYPGSLGLHADAISFQAFIRLLAEYYKAYREELQTSFDIGGNPLKGFITTPYELIQWFAVRDNHYGFNLKSASAFGLSNILGSFRLNDNKEGLIIVGNYSFIDNPDVNININFKKHMQEDDITSAFTITEYDKEKVQVGLGEIQDWTEEYTKNISLDALSIRIFKVVKI
jgi:hypothetical protein